MAKSKKDIVTTRESLDPNKEQANRLNKILSLQRENDIIAMLLDGKSSSEIANYVSAKYNIAYQSVIARYITPAREVIKKRKGYELNNMLTLHIIRYEELYAKLYEMGAMAIAMKALTAKERLFGFHKEGFHMRVTQGEISAVSLQQIGSEYDVMRLSKERRKRMDELVQKMAVDVQKGRKSKLLTQ